LYIIQFLLTDSKIEQKNPTLYLFIICKKII